MAKIDLTVLRPATGGELRGNCPQCDDARGHFYYNLAKRVFHCFRCGWSGRDGGSAQTPARLPFRGHVTRTRRASRQKLHEAYSALWQVLDLSDRHREHLMSPQRGLSGAAARNYRSLPDHGRMNIASRVASLADPAGVPGFYRRHGRWCLAGPPGLLIACRDLNGRIVGVQIRPDRPRSGRKYCWLSSAGRRDRPYPVGVAAKAVYHAAVPVGTTFKRVWITEGPLKADIAALHLGEPVIAVPGVNTWKSSGLLGALRTVGTKEVVMAFDMDVKHNRFVGQAEEQLTRALTRYGLRVCQAVWDPAVKGLDDLLLAGGVVEFKNRGSSANMNTVSVLGHLAAAPKFEQKKLKDGRSCLVGSFTLQHRLKTGKHNYVPVCAYERLAQELAAANLKQGELVWVTGRLRSGIGHTPKTQEAVQMLQVVLSSWTRVSSNGKARLATQTSGGKT